MNSIIDKNTLGIIGGMGPRVDGELITLIHNHTSATEDSEHIPIILDGNCSRPDRSRYLCGDGESPLPSILSSLHKLETAGANIIAIPCNTAHCFARELKASAKPGVTVIDMVNEVCQSCKRRSFNTVTLLATSGTYRSGIYEKRLRSLGMTCIYPDENVIKEVCDEIKYIKSGQSRNIKRLIEKALCVSDGVITGCTELSISIINNRELKTSRFSERIADSLSILAASCIKSCKKQPSPIHFT